MTIVDGLILLTQAGLLALLFFLAFRVSALVRTEALAAGHSGASHAYREQPHDRIPAPTDRGLDRTELITQLHILGGLQERDCRVRGLNLAAAPEAVRLYAAAWLYGAACALCGRSERHTDRLAATVAHIASRKTGIRHTDAHQALATLTSSTVLLACYRSGLEGAEFWRYNHYVPPTSSLYEAITSNAFI